MAWERRRKAKYFYHSVRRDGGVRKIYYGPGPAGRLAADAHALERAERQAERAARHEALAALDSAQALTCALGTGCDLLASAALLLAGFHRHRRHFWRIWKDGREALEQLG